MMNAKYDFRNAQDRIVYVKSVDVADLPEDLQEQAGGRKQLFSVHTEAGEQIALVTDRQMAFVLARQNDMTPMAVH